ncbi:MAG TPA: Xaa-Pro peptidase family protein [Spirochaetia bacterium]|nr:Xaa-Pro peptidase family protein [Spirochaetia bacterium]
MPQSDRLTRSFRRRQKQFSSWLAEAGIFACVLDDFEGLRASSLRWLCGHPMDAILFVFASGRTVLVPWDANLANEMSAVDEVVPYTNFKRSFREAVTTVLKEAGATAGSRPKIEFLGHTTYLRHRELMGDLPDAETLIRSEGCDAHLGSLRAVKDEEEMAALEKAAGITDQLCGAVTKLITDAPAGSLTENEMALFLQREAVARGAEGMGFETLAAGPGRSWGIHPFPASTSGAFGGKGLSILDFGVKVEGYTSDVTVTVARGKLTDEQERMIGLVERAYEAALQAARPGASPRDPAAKADEIFGSAGWRMPHALGHGIGLDAHERPLLHIQGSGSDSSLAHGMVFTIEPGLYHPQHGGVRWENDVLMTDKGPKVLTNAKIIRLP